MQSFDVAGRFTPEAISAAKSHNLLWRSSFLVAAATVRSARDLGSVGAVIATTLRRWCRRGLLDGQCLHRIGPTLTTRLVQAETTIHLIPQPDAQASERISDTIGRGG